jgi:hypothetical protein
MSRRIVILASLIVILLMFSQTIINETNYSVSGQEPEKLKIFVSPSNVPADSSSCEAIYVQLQDSSGKPARALKDTQISLSSSLTNIGTVDSSITIQKGATYAVSKFYSTFTPGTTTITATASGYATVQAPITTVGPIPSAIAVYGFPPSLPAGGGSYDAIVVQLQDSSGSPAKAPQEGIQVTLSSSNTAVGTVTPSVTIEAGKTQAVANFTTGAVGSAVVTAVASGYTSKQTTIKTQSVAANPTTLKVYVAPPKVPADKNTYQQIVVQLQNSAGNIAQASGSVTVTMASSNIEVGAVQPLVTIPQSETYVTTTFATEYKAGTTTVTAVATDLSSDQETVTTVGPVPSKLAVYCSPSSLPSDNRTYNVIRVQLQDSQGKPAKDPASGVTVFLFSSEPTVGTVDASLTIPFGETQATGKFYAQNAPGSTSITAQASDYTSGQAQITTYFIDLSSLIVTVTADPAAVMSGKQSEITAHVMYDSVNPASGAAVKFVSDNGGSFSAVKDKGDGYYTALFTAPNLAKTTNCTITATASKSGYVTSQGNMQLTVQTTASTGTLQICVEDDESDPVENAVVTSTSQPIGMGTIAGTTNATGHVTFADAQYGTYTLKIIKTGYLVTNQTINFTGQTTVPTMFISKDPSSTPDSSPLLLYIAIIIVIVAVSIVVVVVVIRKRRKIPITKLPPKFRSRSSP